MEKQKIWLVREITFYCTAQNTDEAYEQWGNIDEEEVLDCINCDADIWFDDFESAKACYDNKVRQLTAEHGGCMWHDYNGLLLGYADADEDCIWDDSTWEQYDCEFAWADYE